MSLTKEEADNVRDGDIILVPLMVERTNNHFATGIGMKIVTRSIEVDHRSREEREKGPRLLDIMSRCVHSVAFRQIRLGDWVEWFTHPASDLVATEKSVAQGKVVHIDGKEYTIKQRECVNPRNKVLQFSEIRRILPPTDLTAIERVVFGKSAA